MASASKLSRLVPYFDMLLDQFAHDNRALEVAFGQHVHWGYWDVPRRADLSPAGYRRAAIKLSEMMIAEAQVANGQSVLDVGCGFGGTMRLLADRFKQLTLTGLNLDPRQIARARTLFASRPREDVSFVLADACAMPFADRRFDTILAIECIHHFASREAFLERAHRSLLPGGRIVLSDFILNPATLPLHKACEWLFADALGKIYGVYSSITLARYRLLATRAHLRMLKCIDITANTTPSMQYLKMHVGSVPGQSLTTRFATNWYRMATAARSLRYVIIVLEKP